MNADDIYKLLNRVREEKPLVHLITNSVTRNDCANVVIAIGASPIMATDSKEVEEVVSVSKALVLNIGTIEENIVEPMILAGKKANNLDIPVILDPVGVGVSDFRKTIVEKIFENIHVSIIKGNQSEIKTICGLEANSKGVDSGDNDSVDDITRISQILSNKTNSVVAVTGKIDVISQLGKTVYISNGNKMLKSITGTGCMGTALVGVFATVAKNMLEAAVAGISLLNTAGDIAYKKIIDVGGGCGSFKVYLFDSIGENDPFILDKIKFTLYNNK